MNTLKSNGFKEAEVVRLHRELRGCTVFAGNGQSLWQQKRLDTGTPLWSSLLKGAFLNAQSRKLQLTDVRRVLNKHNINLNTLLEKHVEKYSKPINKEDSRGKSCHKTYEKCENLP